MTTDTLEIKVIDGLAEVDAAEWDALVSADDPFTEHAFLAALEDSGSVGGSTGWTPRHVLVRQQGRLVAAMPLYLKDHSYGEYIFDWGWASAAERAGIRYYPKLVSAVPHTPATGRRLLTSCDLPLAPLQQALLQGVRAVADASGASSAHVLFMTADERAAVAEHGWLPRLTYQFHWQNEGFSSFDDFLAGLRSPARKQIRRERRVANELGLAIETVPGHALTGAEWDAIYGFYRDTAARKGAFPYLTHAFFRMCRTRLGHLTLVTMARREGVPVAGALSFRKGQHLYGRYWGCRGDFEMLHFELCYYRLVDYAIAAGITLFEAGAQGEHKLKRGFLPRPTYSAHWLRHPGLQHAVAEYLPREERAALEEMAELLALGPHRRCEERAVTKIRH